MAWHPGQIYEAWGEIHRALYEAMTPLPPHTLAFLAERASDRIIRDKAAEVLDRLDSLDEEDEDALSRADALRRLFRKETRGAGQPESDGDEPPGLEQAVAFAKANQQASRRRFGMRTSMKRTPPAAATGSFPLHAFSATTLSPSLPQIGGSLAELCARPSLAFVTLVA